MLPPPPRTHLSALPRPPPRSFALGASDLPAPRSSLERACRSAELIAAAVEKAEIYAQMVAGSAQAPAACAQADSAAERRKAWDRERKQRLLAGLTGMEWNALRQEVFR